MSKIAESILVRCPFNSAASYMDAYLATLNKTTKGERRLALNVPLDTIGLPGGLVLSHDVRAEFAQVNVPDALIHMTTIYWEPEGGGPFPRFLGTLTVQADEDPGSTWLELEGHYDPPLGRLGDVFDAAIGRKIARATATTLLRDLKLALEQCHIQALKK